MCLHLCAFVVPSAAPVTYILCGTTGAVPENTSEHPLVDPGRPPMGLAYLPAIEFDASIVSSPMGCG